MANLLFAEFGSWRFLSEKGGAHAQLCLERVLPPVFNDPNGIVIKFEMAVYQDKRPALKAPHRLARSDVDFFPGNREIDIRTPNPDHPNNGGFNLGFTTEQACAADSQLSYAQITCLNIWILETGVLYFDRAVYCYLPSNQCDQTIPTPAVLKSHSTCILLTHTTGMRDFAQELVDLVLDNVAAGAANLKDIGNCGSVCKRWLPPSRKHLFSHLTISNLGSPTPQSFLDLVDTSRAPVLSLVRTLHVCLSLEGPPIAEHHILRLKCPSLVELRIDGLQTLERLQKLDFVHWVYTNIPRMSLSLTQLELILPTSFPTDVLADLLSGLSLLSQLTIGSKGRKVRVRAFSSSGCSATHVPGSTWLAIHSRSIDAPYEFAPLETYLHRFGPRIHSLTLAYSLVEVEWPWSWSLARTRALHARTLTCTPRLVNQMLFAMAPESIPDTLVSLPSPYLASLEVRIFLKAENPLLLAPPPDWAAIDALVVTSQFGSLQRLSFIDHFSKKSLITDEVRVLMPQANARGILRGVSPLTLDEYIRKVHTINFNARIKTFSRFEIIAKKYQSRPLCHACQTTRSGQPNTGRKVKSFTADDTARLDEDKSQLQLVLATKS
ncbi:hypothetical protein B0H16DRAFT_1454736 [Mycena metata]|uniref:Uncharacterized protein n=1 Tax=Mycena metata TaxID=1033252 RepID=A0AAD7JHL1_9AGAR|nr:hypothetical protein B0H16DRAFT_1454736 [Mycena metata]